MPDGRGRGAVGWVGGLAPGAAGPLPGPRGPEPPARARSAPSCRRPSPGPGRGPSGPLTLHRDFPTTGGNTPASAGGRRKWGNAGCSPPTCRAGSNSVEWGNRIPQTKQPAGKSSTRFCWQDSPFLGVPSRPPRSCPVLGSRDSGGAALRRGRAGSCSRRPPPPSPGVRSPSPALVVFPRTYIGIRNYDLLPRSGAREGRGLLLDGEGRRWGLQGLRDSLT